jgi:hypothetical protein
VTHAAGAGGLPPLGLDGPVELPDPGLGIPAASALLLLDVERDLEDTNVKFMQTERNTVAYCYDKQWKYDNSCTQIQSGQKAQLDN